MKEILITSSVLILVLLVLRLIFGKKVRRSIIYAAWALVALRLLIPIQIGQFDFSVLTAARPLTETVTEIEGLRVIGQNEREAETQVILDYIQHDQTVFNPETQILIQESLERNENKEEIATHISKTQSLENTFVPEAREQVQRQVEEQTNFVSVGQVATTLWLAGVVVMAVWFAVVNFRHGRMLQKDRQRLDCDSPIPVFVSDKVGSPCLVGLLRPVIYLTPESATDETTRHHVLTHELTHYGHGDHIWSWVRCVCLCVYWFDPLVWLAAWCSRRDCELACDEGALKRLGEDERIAYGKSLLDVVSHASAPAHLMQTATAMNETKEQLKQRVNFIVKTPKWSLVAAVCMVLVCAIVAGCATAGAVTETQSGEGNPTIVPTEPSHPTQPTEPSEPTDFAHPEDCTCNEGKVMEEPGCTWSGRSMRYCAFEERYIVETIGALGHDFGDPFVSLEPTCGKNGIVIVTCSRCNEKEAVEVLSKTGGCVWELVEIVEQEYNPSYERYCCGKCGTSRYIYLGEKGAYDLDSIEQIVAEYIRERGYHVIFADEAPDTYGSDDRRTIDFSHCEMMGGPDYLLERALNIAAYVCNEFEKRNPNANPGDYTWDVWLSCTQDSGTSSAFIIIIKRHDPTAIEVLRN